MNKTITTFIGLLTILMLLVLGLHIMFLHLKSLPLFDNYIVPCYLFNYLLASLTFVGLVVFKDKLSSSLGFVFMGASMLKFGLFFLFFYPSFNADGDVSRQEFASFFIPYAISLIVEVYYLVRTLNK